MSTPEASSNRANASEAPPPEAAAAATPPVDAAPGELRAEGAPPEESDALEGAPSASDEDAQVAPSHDHDAAEPAEVQGELSAEGDEESSSDEDAQVAPSDSLDAVEPADIDGELSAEAGEEAPPSAARFSPERIRCILESLLFVSDKPLTLDAIEECTGISHEEARAALVSLSEAAREGQRGVVLNEVAGGWQFRTAPESAEFVRRMLQIKPHRLTRAALETLALFAYRQPITRPEVEQVRGVDSGAVIKALLERKLIKILGKKEEVGRPILYGTTREFLEFFNLKDLASLPTLREFQELSEENREIVDEQSAPPAGKIEGLVAEQKDDAFVARQRASAQASEDALQELENAIGDAERKTKATEEILRPPAEPAAEPGEA
jgi:segregation and condensation protein B